MARNDSTDSLGKGMAKLRKDETVLPTRVDTTPKPRVQINKNTWIETNKSEKEAKEWFNRKFPHHAELR